MNNAPVDLEKTSVLDRKVLLALCLSAMARFLQ